MKLTQNFFLNLLWVFTFTLSVSGLIFYVRQIFIKWNSNPDIMTTVKLIPSYEIPMPAITICSPLVVKTEFYDQTKFLPNFDTWMEKCFFIFLQTCSLQHSEWVLEFELNSYDFSVRDFDKCGENFIYEVTFADKLNNSEHYMSRVMTNYGFCYSLNLIENVFNKKIISKEFDEFRVAKDIESEIFDKVFVDEPQWSLSDGYSSESSDYPLRASVKNHLGFMMILNNNDESNICREFTKTYTLFIHKPNEIPTTFHDENFVKFEGTKNIYITAKYFTADESLKGYSPTQRRCYFEGEKKLKFFASYTKAQCEFECLTNFTLKSCGCVRYSMPRDDGMRMCGIGRSICIDDAFNDLNVSYCDCLEPCVDIKYDVKYEKSGDFDYRSGAYFYGLPE